MGGMVGKRGGGLVAPNAKTWRQIELGRSLGALSSQMELWGRPNEIQSPLLTTLFESTDSDSTFPFMLLCLL
jgi:hypothetical protein